MSIGNNGLPPGWAIAPLSELVDRLTNGYVGPTRGIYQQHGVPYLLSKHVRGNVLAFDGKTFITNEFNEKNLKSKLRVGDVLLVQTGHVGESAVVPPEHHGHNCHALIVISPKKGLLTGQYLSLQFASPAVQRIFSSIEKGMTLRHLNCHDVIKMDIHVAPADEQRRIVAKIETVTAKSRRAKAALEAIPPLIERFKQSVLASAFRGDLTAEWRKQHSDVEPASELLKRIRVERRRKWERAELAKMQAAGKVPKDDRWKDRYQEPKPVDTEELPELPAGWGWISLEEASWDSGYGTSIKCSETSTGPAVLRIPNVTGGRIDLSNLKFLTEAMPPGELDREKVTPGDLLIVRTNGSHDLIGRGAVATTLPDSPLIFASYLIRLRLVQVASLPDWIATVWPAPQHRRTLESSAATSAGQYNVSLSSLNAMALPLPPSDEQAEAARLVARHLEHVAGVEKLMATAVPGITRLDQSILAKAFRGELVPQDPNDEPASVMLERIKAEGSSVKGRWSPYRSTKRSRS